MKRRKLSKLLALDIIFDTDTIKLGQVTCKTNINIIIEGLICKRKDYFL